MLFNAAQRHGVHDGMSCLLAQAMLGEIDGGDRWCGQGGHIGIVEADHRHILRNAQTVGQQLFCGARDVEILWERYGSA